MFYVFILSLAIAENWRGVTHGIILGFVLDCVIHSLIISLAIIARIHEVRYFFVKSPVSSYIKIRCLMYELAGDRPSTFTHGIILGFVLD